MREQTMIETLRGWQRAVGLGIAAGLLIVSGGCRSVGGLLGSKDAEVRSGTVWNVPAPDIPPLALDQRVAYVSVRNLSDADTIDIVNDVRAAVSSAGYRVIDDPTAANYRLRATIRYFGENESADEGRSLANNLGTIGGAATGVAGGVGAAHLMRSAGANRTITRGVGYGVGGVAGSLTGIAIANRMKAREWNLIVDILLEERMDDPITFTVASDRRTHSDAGVGVHTGRSGVDHQRTGGSTRDTTSTAGEMERTSDFFPHGVRLTVWTRQIGMTESEALPILQQRLRNVLPRILPE